MNEFFPDRLPFGRVIEQETEKDECSESINQEWSESATNGKGQNSESTNSRTYQTWNVSKVS